jgi:peptidoglycan/LPS O-acetylase OafA/YrhL
MSGPVESRRLCSIDALRGLAALAVLLYHVPHLQHLPPSGNRSLFLPFDYGARGVNLFLVISGFCIHLSVARRLASGQGASCNWGAFWWRRCYRLYPPYLAAILFSFLCMLPLGGSHPQLRLYLDAPPVLAQDLATHLVMIHNLFPPYILGLGNGAFWTLGLEEQLYALYAGLLLLRARLSAPVAYLVVFAVTLLWYLPGVVAACRCPLPPGEMPPLWWPAWPFAWWAAWALGAVAAEAYAGAIALPRWCYHRGVALALAGVGVVCYPMVLSLVRVDAFLVWLLGADHWLLGALLNFWVLIRVGDYALVVAFFIVINRWVRAEAAGRFGGPVRRWFARIGVISYSLYLTHAPLIHLIETGWLNRVLSANVLGTLLRYVLYVPLCLGVAALFFRGVESRFLNASRSVAVPPAEGAARARAA